MRKSILTASIIALTVATIATSASAKEAIKVNSASCDYASSPLVTTKSGQQNYKIACVRESASGYQVWTYGIGKDQSVKMVASGKTTLVYNQKTKALQDGKKIIFVYKGTNIRSAVTPIATKSVVFTAKSPTLGDFATYFNTYATCAQ
jgi:hypothetical protein